MSHLGTSPIVLPNEVGLIMITQKSEIVKAFLATRNEKFWFVFAAAARLEDFKIFLRFLTTTVTST